MTVHFIGAGPGAADLITVRGRDLIAASPVCLYAGALVPIELLEHCPPGARKIDTANLTLDEIIAELATAHTAGQDVARLHSGDPSVFSAMAEQMRRLDTLDIPYDVTPGVPAYAAAAASLARELTVPEVGQTVILTRIGGSASAMPVGEDLPSLGASRSTLVLHLAVQQIDRVVDELIPNYGRECPVAVVARASRDDELILRGTLADIAGQVKSANIRRTAVIIAGKVLSATTFRDSHLYSADRTR
ncbi:precorrin-4 C(11)-methyltransferase [Kribbella pratensis]|uniref:Precorrin-4/cobalt-precorrin-4 C11-methyltransferase n=1 Tax=Kribbella pratensis TaxID=2512112 RepID=A0A4R8BYX8_9ACTN|nr:precorrin-4 C(11)-methyltransferase [Kribbella pratensis]TDW66846.1 precorrin-4/cobalt-precorrin-4 C11-methyltransferase [Kribbella pratensis]